MSQRMEKINELIQQELSKIIHKEYQLKKGLIATIQEVETAADLKTAKVWISIFPDLEKDKEKYIEKLQAKAGEIQKILSPKINLKFTPKLQFKLDKTGIKVQKIDQIIEGEKKF